MTPTMILTIAIHVSMAVLLLSACILTLRLMRGPTAADRLVAVDMIGLVAAACCAGAALLAGHAAFLDVALGVTLVSFLGTAAFAGLIERAADQGGAARLPAE